MTIYLELCFIHPVQTLPIGVYQGSTTPLCWIEVKARTQVQVHYLILCDFNLLTSSQLNVSCNACVQHKSMPVHIKQVEVTTVVLWPLVHRVSPITTKVHWIESSQLDNQPTIPIKGNLANTRAKFCNFLGRFGPGKLIVTITDLD
jgi:hypothetical protein